MKPTIKLFFFATLFIGMSACSDSEDAPTTLEQDEALLAAEFERIQSIASSVPCADPGDWDVSPYGAKPCGGPWGYIAYPKSSINVVQFLTLIENYNEMNEAINVKWGLISNCRLEARPTGVDCVNGEAVLIY